MGMWGPEPWQSDSAADWYAEAIPWKQLTTRIEKALKIKDEDRYEEIRAAAYLVLVLGHVHLWPISSYDKFLQLAVDGLERIHRWGVFSDNTEYEERIEAEIQLLKRRQADSTRA